ncbi:hypothetical protein E2320_000014, partial [Naja naja]
MTNKSLVGRVWIATTLTALSVSIFDLWVDLQNRHALFSFLIQTNRRTQYYNFTFHISMVIMKRSNVPIQVLCYLRKFGKMQRKENWEFPPHDVIARILSQDSSSISQIIQILAWVLSAASSSQWSKRRMQVGYHQPPQIVQPWLESQNTQFEGSYLEGFETLISNLKSVLINRILAQSKKPILKNKNWFDRDCVQLKRTYNKEYRKSKNAPSEDHTHYLKQLKAQYKTLLKEKKSAALKESWQRLTAAVKTKIHPFSGISLEDWGNPLYPLLIRYRYMPGKNILESYIQTLTIYTRRDIPASGMLAAIIQIIDMTNKSLVGRVWIATTLTALSVSIFDLWVDLQNRHALFSFLIQTNRRTQYYNFKSHISMVIMYGKEAFQCSYSSPLLSKKIWKKCREKENWEFPPHDVIARILSQDSSSISQIIQILAWVLSAASSSQRSKRRMQVGYHQPPQIVPEGLPTSQYFQRWDFLMKMEFLLVTLISCTGHQFGTNQMRGILAQSKKPILKNKNWFDRDCVQLRRTYNKEYRKSKNAPSKDHTHYLKQLKTQYKTLLKEKKSAALKESWQRLTAAVKTKNTSLFWHITRELGKSPLPPINQVPIHAWEEHFRELYTDPDYVTKESQISLDQTPYWSPVTPGEIS